jgi:hypothetical protein
VDLGSPDTIAPLLNPRVDADLPGSRSDLAQVTPPLADGPTLAADSAANLPQKSDDASPVWNSSDAAPTGIPAIDSSPAGASKIDAHAVDQIANTAAPDLPDAPASATTSDAARAPAGDDATLAPVQGADASPSGTTPPVDAGSPDSSPAAPTPDTMPAAEPGVVTGALTGLPKGVMATVILGNDGFMASQKMPTGGTYRFTDVPEGTYFLKVQAPGYDAGPARQVVVAPVARKMRAMEMPMGAQSVDAEPASPSLDFEFAPLPTNQFKYHWQEDVSRGGYETTAHIVQPPQVTFLDQPVVVPELAAADTLNAQFAIVLSDEDQAWNSELAYRLLETLRSVPQPVRKNAGEQNLKTSKWILSNRHIAGDVELTYASDGTTVTISADAFVYATPRLVMVDGERGRFFSKRLHHALVRYTTHNGTDLTAVEKILTERFGCTTVVPDYTALTTPTTGEDAGRFMAFHPDELLQIMDMFEEMPDGYHKIVGRRGAGLVHPRYPTVPAVAWALPDLFPKGSYIEFMDSAFTADPDDTHRLILHEKAHFLWGYVFSKQLRDDWTTLGGWYPDSADPDGWSTTKTTDLRGARSLPRLRVPREDPAT